MMASMIMTFWCFIAGGIAGAAVKNAGYKDGALSLEAANASVSELLEAIARTAGIDVFIARGHQPAGDRKTMKIEGQSVEDVLRSILRGQNYAAVYVKEGDAFRMASLKIYPDGQQGGEFVPLFSGGRTPVYEEKGHRGETVTVMVSSTGDVVTQGQLGRSGVLGPSQTSVAEGAQGADAVRTPWFALQAQLESQETAKFQEIMLLQKRVEAATDPATKQSLSMIYADELAKFHAQKKANLNKVEALKRITQYRDITGN